MTSPEQKAKQATRSVWLSIPNQCMLGLDALPFKDRGLEASFRAFWDDRSRQLVVLLSLVTALIWAVAWVNILAHCHWSRLLCRAAQIPCVSVVLFHLYLQWALRRDVQWRIPEHNKGLVLCADLAAGMAYIMLCRDLNEVPGGSHDWMMTCHGWGIFFLQVTSVSALNLHVINVLCFALIEAYAWMEFGSGAIMKRGVSHVLLLLLTCAVLPFAANVFGEVKSRRAFLHRQGSA